MKAALYARFSTSKQRDTSIDDQFRECERAAKAAGLEVVARFEDREISGGTASRPGYQLMLAAARRHDFDIIVTEEIERLWRNRAEFGPRSAELEDLGVHCLTCVGDDTRRDGWGLVIQIKQAMGEHARRQGSYRTRRGLEGRARRGECAGGKAYGYLPPVRSPTGRLQIEPERAQVVRQIFTWYADGWSPKAIAGELNRQRLPSPGSAWARTERRASCWMPSAIAGDVHRGIGILNNELYRGRVVWNRVRWIRSAADSSKRRCLVNARSEWIEREDEELRIVPQALWDRVKARQQSRASTIGAKVKAGVKRDRAQRTGRDPKFLFSGLLKCGQCGANFVMAGKDHYACASRLNGGTAACDNDAYLRRSQIQPGLVAGIKRELSVPEVLDELERRVRQRLKKGRRAPDNRARIAKLEREVASLVDAIASGALRASPGIAQRLQDTEAVLARLKAQPAPGSIEQLLTELAQRCRSAIENLEKTLMVDPRRGRMEIAEHVGPIRVTTTPEEIRLEAQKGHMESMLLAATGTGGARQVCVVAGAGFEPATFGL